MICFVLMACAELDLENDWDKVTPFIPFLDKAWLLPMNLMIDQSPTNQSFMNLKLSYRGAERQAPSVLSLALQFSHVMTLKATAGTHPSDWNTEKRLRAVVDELHSSEGFLAKWQIDSDKLRAIQNLLIGTTSESRAIIAAHLNYHKYQYSGFSSELLRNCRWLLGAYPTKVNQSFKSMLTVSKEIQLWFLKNHVHTFVNAVRRVKLNSRQKARPNPQEWERTVDYTCVMYEVYKQATDFHEDETARQKCLASLKDAFMARRVKVCFMFVE